MSDVRTVVAPAPPWLRPALWIIAVVIAAIGLTLAIVTASPWPLVSFAGLALPMIPTRARATGAGAGTSHPTHAADAGRAN